MDLGGMSGAGGGSGDEWEECVCFLHEPLTFGLTVSWYKLFPGMQPVSQGKGLAALAIKYLRVHERPVCQGVDRPRPYQTECLVARWLPYGTSGRFNPAFSP